MSEVKTISTQDFLLISDVANLSAAIKASAFVKHHIKGTSGSKNLEDTQF